MLRTITLMIVWLVCGSVAMASPAPAVPPAFEFIRNDGQWPATVQFAVPLAVGQLFVERASVLYTLVGARPDAGRTSRITAADSVGPAPPRHGHAYRVHFEGANADSQPVGLRPTNQRRNYFRGPDPAAWASNVPSFSEIHYDDLYPHIRLQFYENAQQQLEYTFMVQPGGQPEAIGLRYEGTNGLSLDEKGNLRIGTSLGTVSELAPRAWQLGADGQRQAVACTFALANGRVRFQLGSYDTNRPLVIDPVITFATFSGASAENWGHTAAGDAQGNFYTASTVFEAGYPGSTGAFDPSYNGSVDVAIIKYNPAATGAAARVYATYLGGSEADVPHRLVANAQGELFILGTTSSANFPITAGAYDPSFKGGPPPQLGTDGIEYRRGIDLFVARLSADGSQLLASTFLGGSGTDGFALELTPAFGGPPVIQPGTLLRFLGDVQLDAAGNVCVASSTNSSNFPAVAAYATTYRGGRCDAVVCQFSPDLRQLRWSTFLGGTDADGAYALAPDQQGGLYAVGGTLSRDFPFSAGAYQSPSGGLSDAFVVHLSANGRVLLAASRLGTAAQDVARLVQLDGAGNVVVLGQSTGLMPVMPGCYGVPGHNFLQGLSADLSQLRFAATIGREAAYPMPADIALGVDECDRIYVTTLAYFDQVVDVATPPIPSVNLFYAVRLSAGARVLEYATVLPGEHVHGASRFDKHGSLYLAVCGNCDAQHSFNLPTGVNTFSAHTATGKCNDASLKITIGPSALESNVPQVVCANAGPVTLGGNPSGGVWTGPGVTPAPGGGYQFVPSVAFVGVPVSLSYTPPSTACPVASLRMAVTPPTPIVLAPVGPLCYNTDTPQSTRLSGQPAGGSFSGPGVVYSYPYPYGPQSWSFSPVLAGPGTHTITYMLNQNGQCGTATQTIVVGGARVRLFPTDTSFCGEAPRPFQFRAIPTGGTWSGRNITPSGYWTPTVVNPTSYNNTYTYTSPDGCVTRQNYQVNINADVVPNAFITPPACPNFPNYNGLAPATFTFPAQSANARYYWEYGDGTFSGNFVGGIIPQIHTYDYPGTYTATLRIMYGYSDLCTRTIQYAPIIVGESQPFPNIITPNGDGLNETFVQRQFCEAPTLRIFSRWGQEVYHTERYLNNWDATGLANGIYYYRFEGQQGRTAKGWLEVRR